MAHPITVDVGGVPAGTLLFRRMTGTEELGRPFEYQLELLSANEALSFAGVVGQPLAVHLELPGGGTRHFHGIVTRFAQGGWSERRAIYHATLRPSLWLLGRRAGSRIFQGKAVPDILRAVLSEYGFPLQVSLSGSHAAREYVVQYRESDLDFVSRLMEQEGIYYFFRHAQAKHTLVLADAAGAHQAAAGYEEIPFYPPQPGEKRERDHVDTWEPSEQIEPTAFATRDYDFTRPRANLEVKRAREATGSPELEIYDYPGGYVQTSEGERYARTRLEELAAARARAEGAGNARGIAAGVKFTLKGHPRHDQDREYLVVAAACELELPEYESGGAPSAGPVFRCRFVAQESRTPFRSPRTTRRPVVAGPQTARVVGKAGEEIWTDAYGRVKLQFHWDRASPGDENSSCWVRVAQAWAGGGWGAVHVPRIGEEVVVEFLEGDPDRPIVTGHLHEADHMPPWALPANQTQSGFRSHSTKGGGPDDFNELRLEDRKGDEQLHMQAQKDYELLVKNDATTSVGHDEKHEVKNDETHTVKHDRKKSVGNDETTDVTGKRTESVGKDESVTIGGSRTESVAKDETITVDGARSLTVAKDETIDVSGSETETVGKDASLTVSGKQTISVGKDLSVTVSGGRNTTVSKDDVLTVDKKLLVSAADQIVLECGSAKLVLKKDGTIQLDGKDLTLKGSGKINVNASGDVVVKGSNVKQN